MANHGAKINEHLAKHQAHWQTLSKHFAEQGAAAHAALEAKRKGTPPAVVKPS
jgi:hypothetical protein